MVELSIVLKMSFAIVVVGFINLCIHLYNVLWVKPERLRSELGKQGIRGPPRTLVLGNILDMKRAQSAVAKSLREEDASNMTHNLSSRLFPFFEQWRSQYGHIFMFAVGNAQLLHVTQPDIVKEISVCTSLNFGKPSYQHKDRGPLLGQGILTSNGIAWAHQRKIIAPQLYMDKVKGMIDLITESTISLMNLWKSKIENGGGVGEIKIDEDLRSFSGDVISRACFGSSYSKARDIFLKLRLLQDAMSKKSLTTGIPGMRYVPTKSNREIWRLEKEIRRLILKVVKEREASKQPEKDLLQTILEGAKEGDLSPEATDRFIVDNCKNIYLAGYETTAVSSLWTLMLLASHPEWQARVRQEVLQVCGSGKLLPDADMLRRMKLLTMVIHESLRLYPPVAIISREALKDMKFGDIHVPESVNVWTSVTWLHLDPEYWGPDSYKFNPDRFANGIAGACKLPYLYMPFGVGPRICLGQNLAMQELKILLSLILTNFSFSLSPNYRHSPALRLVIEPEHGIDLLITRLQ
ncbi:PREDICTED: cytochrome P450 714C2-like [Nelumbo nucifera]|uniref:Cytochrome P450 714C2-like n=2 Tax=Nelumbo nucifera TaxID=4432 RepID=A0A822Z5A5_NELNU|nr:PREDICTED: cytochrome P450 714C2-like [Nelumbo nucifera]DAD38549.1 TPA_asm: hypothetical protein HUJ06_012871 [Nelumbo nucifera]